LQNNEAVVVEEHIGGVDEHTSEETTVGETYQRAFSSIGRTISLADGFEAKLAAWRNGLHEALVYWHGIERPDIFDECYRLAEAYGLVDQFGDEKIQETLAAEAQTAKKPQQTNGKYADEEVPHTQAQAAPVVPHPTFYVAPDEASIPQRAWLLGGHYIRQAATATVAPGGWGKTTLTLYEAITMVAAGLAVWYLSGEDPRVEIDRRIAAHCRQHGITLSELPGKLFVDDRSSFPMFIAKSPRAAAVTFDDKSLEQFEHAIVMAEIDVVMLDPFVSFHSVPENDNGCVDAVVKRIAAIAQRTNSCIEISHHVRKMMMGFHQSITVDDSRGGGAIINAVRSGRVINRMNSTEADQAHIDPDQRHFYLRVDKGKRNMAPPDKAVWYELKSVELANGDHVQALATWDFPKVLDNVSIEDTDWVRDLVRRKAYRVDTRSSRWLGLELARRFKKNPQQKADISWMNKLIGIWLIADPPPFKKMEMRDQDERKKRMFYVSLDAKGDTPYESAGNVVELFPHPRGDVDDDGNGDH
jgi:hypothetical protein